MLAEADLSGDFLDALAALEKGFYQLQTGRRQPEVGRYAEFGAEIAPELAFGNLALAGERRHAKAGPLGTTCPIGDGIKAAAHSAKAPLGGLAISAQSERHRFNPRIFVTKALLIRTNQYNSRKVKGSCSLFHSEGISKSAVLADADGGRPHHP